MIRVTGNEDSKIYYECDCGTSGFCLVKEQDQDAAVVLDVECPHCSHVERMVLLQYSSEENKKKLLENLNEMDLSWSFVLENEVVEGEE